MTACFGCVHHIRSREQAGIILKRIIAQATIREIPGGGALIEAVLDNRQVMTLCLWEAACEDCEDTFDQEEDRTAHWLEPS